MDISATLLPLATWLKKCEPRPRDLYLTSMAGFIIVLVPVLIWNPVPIDTYKQLRGSLFTGFFSVSGFLLSAVSLVILNMKKEVYDTEEYLTHLHEKHWSFTEYVHKANSLSREECGLDRDVYRPLSQVGSLLTANIILAVFASFAQITLGLIESCWAVACCLALAMSTAILLICSVCVIWLNFSKLYKGWEDQAQAKLKRKWDESLAKFNAAEPPLAPAELPVIPMGIPSETAAPDKPKRGKK